MHWGGDGGDEHWGGDEDGGSEGGNSGGDSDSVNNCGGGGDSNRHGDVDNLVQGGSSPCVFTIEEELHFSHRFEEGYDLIDPRYQVWLYLRHPGASMISFESPRSTSSSPLFRHRS